MLHKGGSARKLGPGASPSEGHGLSQGREQPILWPHVSANAACSRTRRSRLCATVWPRASSASTETSRETIHPAPSKRGSEGVCPPLSVRTSKALHSAGRWARQWFSRRSDQRGCPALRHSSRERLESGRARRFRSAAEGAAKVGAASPPVLLICEEAQPDASVGVQGCGWTLFLRMTLPFSILMLSNFCNLAAA